MKIKNHIYTILLLGILVACSSKDPDPIPKEVIDDPVAVTLEIPANNTECNEGIILSDTESKVVFRWSASEHTDSYEVVLKKTQAEVNAYFESTTNSNEIILERGTSYEWYVISKSFESEVTAESDTFQFFNAAPGVVNHVPFPAEAISPVNDSDITVPTGLVLLTWDAIDIDDDIKDFEVFFGTSEDNLENKGIFTNTNFEVEVTSGNTYFWKIKTNDEVNNSSTSNTFQFTVL